MTGVNGWIEVASRGLHTYNTSTVFVLWMWMYVDVGCGCMWDVDVCGLWMYVECGCTWRLGGRWSAMIPKTGSQIEGLSELTH